jgi:hypothetical protein
VLALFGVTHCCGYSKIESVIINCNSTWLIASKSSVKSRTHNLFFALPGKHATFDVGSGWIFSIVGIKILPRSYGAILRK